MLLRCLLILAVFAASSCTDRVASPLRIGSNSWLGYEPLYVAREHGFYDHSSIHLIALPSASEVIDELLLGNLEGAALTLDEALTVIDRSVDLQIVLMMDFSNGADALIVKPNITKLADLKGRQIALETTAVGAIMLHSILAKANLSLEDIHLVDCAVDLHENCFKKVDAAITFEPMVTKFKNKGFHSIFDSSQIPGRIVDVLVVKKSIVSEQSKNLRKLLSGYFKARQLIHDSPEKIAVEIAKRLKTSSQDVIQSYDEVILPNLQENYQYLEPKQGKLHSIAEDLYQLMYRQGLLTQQQDLDALITDRFLPQRQ